MSATDSPTDPLIGRTFSQYEIVAKLGGGGMGVVYTARDTRLGRTVALKFLPSQWSHDAAAKQRFMREAQAASATNHRNICVVHNIEETADGRLFIVMAHYDGQTLKHRLESGALPIVDAVDIAMEIAEGLAKAHTQGVVHRDIKPGNLMVTDDGVKILDFGLAKFADALALTAPGSTIGTYAYMSPEQARGEEADERSDVWALGIVMYEMLTGAPPFRGAYPEATFHAIKFEPVPPIAKARADVPEALERIVMKALAKDVAQRYQSARDMARDLRTLAGRSVPLELRTEALPELAERRAREMVRATPRPSWRFAVVGAVAAALVALIGTGAYWWNARPVVRAAVAIAPVANHTGLAELDTYRLALTGELASALDDSPNIRVVPYLRLLEIIRPFILRGGDVSSSEAIQAIAEASGAPVLVIPTLVYRDRDATWTMQVQLRNSATGTVAASYETEPVSSSLSQQTALRLTLLAADLVQEHFREHGAGRPFASSAGTQRPVELATLRELEAGVNAYEVMEYRAAADAFAGAVRADEQNAEAHMWLARALLLLGNRKEALVAAERSAAISGTSGGAVPLLTQAVVAEARADGDTAEGLYQRLASTRTDDPWHQTELADYLKRRQDRNSQAIEAYHAALLLDKTYLRVHVDLCQLHTRLDDYPLADREGQAALQGAKAAGNKSVEAQALLCLAEAQRKSRRDFAQARQLAADARQLLEPINQPYNLARAVFYQGLMDYSAGQYEAATTQFSDAATRLNQVGNSAMEATALMNLGVTSYFTGHPSQTLEILARSSRAFDAIGDERRAAEMEVNLSGLQIEYGIDVDQARRRLRNARINLEKMGHVDFQIGAMIFEAQGEQYSGALAPARQLLRSALAIARDRQLPLRVTALGITLALADVEAGDLASALNQIASVNDDGSDPEVPLTTALVRLAVGDQARVTADLERTAQALAATRDATVATDLETAQGRLELERGRAADALAHFNRAIATWSDPLIPAAVVQAYCLRGEAEARLGRPDGGRESLAAGESAARTLHRRQLIAECAVGRARVEMTGGRPQAALAALREVPDDTEQRRVGELTRISVEYWRARALASLQDPTADTRLAGVRERLTNVQQSLPAEYREMFAARPDVRLVLTEGLAATRAR